jgi:hypothetical protein
MTQSWKNSSSSHDLIGATAEWNTIIEAISQQNTEEVAPNMDAFAVIPREHIRTMETSLQSAVGHLQTSMSWSQTVAALGITAFLAASEPTLKACALSLSIILTASCSTRSAKNYINIIRFGIMHRRSLIFSSACAAKSKNISILLKSWADGINDYQINWKSPVSRATTVRKVLFEFHYVYMFFIQIAIAIKIWIENSQTLVVGQILIVGTMLSILEILHFLFASPYLSHVVEDKDMKSQH